MSKIVNFRVPEEVYIQIEKESKGNKSAWLLEAVRQKLEQEDSTSKTNVLRKVLALEDDVNALKEIMMSSLQAHQVGPLANHANAIRAFEAKDKVKQAIMDYPEATSNAELARLSKVDIETISKYRVVVLMEIKKDASH